MGPNPAAITIEKIRRLPTKWQTTTGKTIDGDTTLNNTIRRNIDEWQKPAAKDRYIQFFIFYTCSCADGGVAETSCCNFNISTCCTAEPPGRNVRDISDFNFIIVEFPSVAALHEVNLSVEIFESSINISR